MLPNVDPLYLHVALIPSDKVLRWEVCSQVVVVFKSDDKPLIRSIVCLRLQVGSAMEISFLTNKELVHSLLWEPPS